jgi:hypothetical protein
MANYTQVYVTSKQGHVILDNGTGSGDMATFACSKFPQNSRPVENQIYSIQALGDCDQFPMDWDATCVFSAETSEFKA